MKQPDIPTPSEKEVDYWLEYWDSLPNYTEPPEDEAWVCCNGEYIRVRNGKLEYIMEDDPYIGCGVMPGNCTCNNCISPGTNYGPSRL